MSFLVRLHHHFCSVDEQWGWLLGLYAGIACRTWSVKIWMWVAASSMSFFHHNKIISGQALHTLYGARLKQGLLEETCNAVEVGYPPGTVFLFVETISSGGPLSVMLHQSDYHNCLGYHLLAYKVTTVILSVFLGVNFTPTWLIYFKMEDCWGAWVA